MKLMLFLKDLFKLVMITEDELGVIVMSGKLYTSYAVFLYKKKHLGRGAGGDAGGDGGDGGSDGGGTRDERSYVLPMTVEHFDEDDSVHDCRERLLCRISRESSAL